jgi:hypothetical protein
MSSSLDWHTTNFTYLNLALSALKAELEVFIGDHKDKSTLVAAQEELHAFKAKLSAQLPLETLAEVFNLSPFEQKLLLLCAGMDLDAQFAQTVARVMPSGATQPTFSLALAALEGADWNALTPNAPLRYWKLLELGEHQIFNSRALRLNESILHYLTTASYWDAALHEFISPAPTQALLAASQIHWISSARALFSPGAKIWPLIQLTGVDVQDKLLATSALASSLQLTVFKMSAMAIPLQTREIHELALSWGKDWALNNRALFLDATGVDTSDKSRQFAVSLFLEQMNGVVVMDAGSWTPVLNRPIHTFIVEKPTPSEQLARWQIYFTKHSEVLQDLERVTKQFNLGAVAIDQIALETQSLCEKPGFGAEIWNKCRMMTRPRIDELAQRIEPKADWDALILPEAQKNLLRELTTQVHLRNQVYDHWGFSAKSERGLGISALFAGESGTGKTMAAEVIANTLQLDLYRIDLSQVVNKYIGETEKNLKRIFDAAESGGCILLFDEADALFGKRSDVKDAHDRYSNIEVSYLLQRMEAYRGLAIMTTNMITSIDSAFYRRIRFIVQFPFPDAFMRAKIWETIFPENTPRQGLDSAKLGRLSVTGGNIRNIALNAAFLAAQSKEPVQMDHIARAVRTEYTKLEKMLSTKEMTDW